MFLASMLSYTFRTSETSNSPGRIQAEELRPILDQPQSLGAYLITHLTGQAALPRAQPYTFDLWATVRLNFFAGSLRSNLGPSPTICLPASALATSYRRPGALSQCAVSAPLLLLCPSYSTPTLAGHLQMGADKGTGQARLPRLVNES